MQPGFIHPALYTAISGRKPGLKQQAASPGWQKLKTARKLFGSGPARFAFLFGSTPLVISFLTPYLYPESVMAFFVYKSSAGSGKTFTLVKEYLKIALSDTHSPPYHYKSILAITFTNKAAGEMKDRILRSLKELCADAGSESGMGAILKKELNLGDDELVKRASALLNDILHHYSDFSVGTIDSFVHRILRAFSFDLKIPFGFDVDFEGGRLIIRAVDELVSRIGSDGVLTQLLLEFAEGKAMEEKSWNIEHDLVKFSGTLLQENSRKYLEELRDLAPADFLKIRDSLLRFIFSFEAEIRQAASEAMRIIENAGLSATDFYHGNTGIAGWFQRLSEGDTRGILPGAWVVKTIREDKWSSSSINRSAAQSLQSVKTSLAACYERIRDSIEKNYSTYRLFRLIRKSIYSLALLNEIEKIMEEMKSRDNTVLISEFNPVIASVVATQPVPFIYERLGERYSHFLVDEFQDTSLLQFQNLLPLIDNCLSQGNFTMVVGDSKQAIYRWRGGEVEQFINLPAVFGGEENPFTKEREASLVRNYQPRNLNRNYRSGAELVRFNNDFFRVLTGKMDESCSQVYAGLEQETGTETDPAQGFVSINILDDSMDAEEAGLNKALVCIEELIREGYRYADIALLVRKNREGNLLADRLAENNIPVISQDSLLLKSSDNVNVLVASLRYLINPEDPVSRAVVARHLVKEGLLKVSFHEQVMIAALSSRKFSESLREAGIPFERNYLLTLSFTDLCSELSRLLGMNPETDAFVLFFLETVSGFMDNNDGGAPEFLEWWDQPGTQPSVKMPDNTNAVTILSIHRSKGLEFPVVILPFAGWKIDITRDMIWINLEGKGPPGLPSALLPLENFLDQTAFAERFRREKSKALLDNLNLIYVAFTRPRERLYVFTPQPAAKISVFNNTADMIGYYLRQPGRLQEGSTVYESGIKTPPVRKNEKSPDAFLIRHSAHVVWKKKLRMRRVHGSTGSGDPRFYGILLHEILARIQTPEQAKDVLEEMKLQGSIDQVEMEMAGTQLQELFRVSSIRNLFAVPGTVKTETGLLMPDGTLLRPDRVVLDGDNALIIDFKTGDRSPSHGRQLARYAEALQQMGVKKVKKCLVYTREKELDYVE